MDANIDELRAQIAALAAQIKEYEAARQRDRSHLSFSAFARRLKISRGRTLVPAVARGEIATVRFGKRVRIPFTEIERVEREGFGPQQKKRMPATVSGHQRAATPKVDVDAELAYMRSTPLAVRLAAAEARGREREK